MSVAIERPTTEPVPPTEPATPAAPPASVVDPEFGPLFRMSVEQYLEAIRVGIFTADDKAELLEGVLVAKMGRKPPHVFATRRVFARLAALLPAGWFVAKEDPFQSSDSVPEPDGMILRGTDEDYRDRYPTAADVPLIVEVAESSLARDRGVKRRAYARAGLPTYWLVELVARQVEVYTDPSGPAEVPDYRTKHTLGPDDELTVVLDGREVGRIAVRDILP